MSETTTTIAVELKASTAAAVGEVGKMNAALRETTTAATVAGSAQQQLGKDVALTSAKVRDSKEAVAGAKQALETHNATVAAFGANSAQAAQSAAKLATAEREAAKAAAVAAEATAKLAKEVQAVAAAEDGQLSPATKRAAAAVARMGETAERTAHDLNKMELQQKKGSAGFDAMGFASGKLMAVLGPAALGGTLIAVAGWLGDAAEKTLQYETAIANLPFTIDAARKSTRGLVSDQALVTAAANASALGVAKTSEQFAGLAAATAKLVKPGQDVNALLNEITGALGRGSSESLNNVNVILTNAEAQRRYAESIGVTVASLTEEQKATAFKVEGLKAVIAAAEETTMAYDSNAAKIIRLKTTTGNAWDEITRATVNASVTIAEALEDKSGQYGPMGPHWLERMVATAQALDTTWSPAFTRGAEATAKWAADLLLAGDAYEVMAQAFNPGTLAAMDAANAKEREKRDILSEEAEFSERMAKAAANVEKANTAFLDAQAAAAVVYGPAAPDKPKKKTGPKKKAGEMLDPGDVAIARTFDGVGQTEIVASAAPEAAAQGRAEAEAKRFEESMTRYERESAMLDAQGQQEAERIDAIFYSLEVEDEAENRRRELQDQRLNREQEYARWQIRNARTDAQREVAQTRLEEVEHRKRIASLARTAADEQRILVARRELIANVGSGVVSLAGSMIGGVEALVNGQRGALARALADWTKDLAVRSGLKALEEFMLAAASAASYNFPAAAAHTTAGGMALAVAAAAGGASAGLGAAASAAERGGAAGGTGGARPAGAAPAGGAPALPAGGGERERLESMAVPVSYGGAPPPGITVIVQLSGPVTGAQARATGEQIRRTLDRTQAQGPRP